MKKAASVFLLLAVMALQSSSCTHVDSKQHLRISVKIHTSHKIFPDCKYFFDDEGMLLTKKAYLRLTKTWDLLSPQIKIISGYNMKTLSVASFQCKTPGGIYLLGQMFPSAYGGDVYLFLNLFYFFTPALSQKDTPSQPLIDGSISDVPETMLLQIFFHEVCHTLDSAFFDRAPFPAWYHELRPEWQRVLAKEPKQLGYSPLPREEWAERCGRTIALEYFLTDPVLASDVRFALGESFAHDYPQSHAFFKKLLAEIIEHRLPDAPIPELVMEEAELQSSH